MNTKDLGIVSFGVSLGTEELEDSLTEMGSGMAGIWMNLSQEERLGFMNESISSTEVFLTKLKLLKGEHFDS